MEVETLLIGLVMPVVVMAIGTTGAIVWRSRNGNGSKEREEGDVLAVRLVELLQGREESFSSMIRTQEITVETQRQIVAGHLKIQGSISELVEIHLKAEGAMNGWQKLLDEKVKHLGDASQRIEDTLRR